jgi:hypothetical protein
VPDDIEQSEMGTIPLATPDPSEQGFRTPATLDQAEDHTVERQARRPESPNIAMDLEPDYAADSVVEVPPTGEWSDGTRLVGNMRVHQPMGTVETRADVDVAEIGKHLGEEADETHGDAGDVLSPSDCSIDEFNPLSPSENSTSKAWLSGDATEDTSDDDVGSLPAQRARRQRKQRSSHSHERTPFSSSIMRQSSSRVRKTTRPRRLLKRTSRRVDPSAFVDASQLSLELEGTGGTLIP